MREEGEDGGLVRGVPPLDVERFVGLGVTKGFGFGENRRVGQALAVHAREDVVTRAVEDAVNELEAICDETLTEGLDDRNTAGDGGFKEEVAAVTAGGGEDLGTVFAEERLVGGDDGLAHREGGEREVAGERGATDQFAHDVDVGIRRDVEGIVGEFRRGEAHGALLLEVAHGGAGEVERDAEAGLE